MKHIPRSVVIMSAGGLLSQLIPLAVAPVLTRLYSPEVFGLFSTFFTFAAVAAIPATLRLDLAVILADSDREASRLAAWTLVLACLILTLLEGGLLVTDHLAPLESLHPLGGLLLLVPLMAWLIAAQGVLMIITNRRRAYKTAATCGVVQQAVNAVVSVLLGLAGAHAGGLIASRLGAFVAGSLTMLRYSVCGFFAGVELRWDEARTMFWRYWQFPLFNVPYSMSGLLSRDFPVIALSSTGYVAFAGQFAIARMASSIPGNFLTSSLSNMFYRESAEFLGYRHFTELIWKLFRVLAQIAFPVFIAVGLVGEELFIFVFGERWHGAGTMFGYLALPFALSMLTGWPERIFEVRAKQHWSFIIQLGFDGLTIAGVILTLSRGGSPLHAVQVYAVIQTCYQLTYIASVFVLAGLGWRRFLSLLAGLVLLAGGLFVADHLLYQWGALGPLSHGLLLLALALAVALRGVRRLIATLKSVAVAD
jgi:O-antigen/teichoic acid export membrane protein